MKLGEKLGEKLEKNYSVIRIGGLNYCRRFDKF